MATGAGPAAADDGLVTTQVNELMDQGPHGQGPPYRDRAGKKHRTQQRGIRACSVNKTNS
eukprot:9462049-Karenia_brevis.AAC.1